MNPEDLLSENSNGGSKPAPESPLLSLERDLKIFNDAIREVAIEIIVEGLSKYPIFIAHQHELKLGEVILDRNELNSEWTIHASTLEEFVERGIVKKELKDRFIASYKSPKDHMCVFVVVPEGANFVFFPFTK